MKVLFVASECAPLVKVGGLADVVGGLPKALVKMGVEVSIALPFYEGIKELKNFRIKELSIGYNKSEEKVEVLQTILPETEIPVYLFKNKTYLSSGPVYSAKSAEGSDLDFDRFSFFSKSVVSFIQQWNNSTMEQFNVIHCHDWHTSWIPLLLKKENSKIKTLLTIHNLGRAYQGITNTPSGEVNILLEGIKNADLLNTVSPSYAKEIQTVEFGEGLESNLSQRKDKLMGILNGIDYEVWNPETDKYLTTNYSVSLRGSREATDAAIYVGWQEGKEINKNKLFQSLGLSQAEKVSLFGMVSRIAEQKGFEILLPALEKCLSSYDIRVIILGTGDPSIENRIKNLELRFKNKLKFITRFDEALAHQIYAGSDFFLMPSHFEPSGLGQLIAMRYGTLPIVRKVGGLADSVKDGVTGFVFEEYNAQKLVEKIEEAIHNFQFSNTNFQKIVETAMKKDFSWEKSAGEYLKLYKKLLS